MAITIPATVAGGSITGFTSPVFTLTPDSAPDTNGKQVMVSGLTSGTANGITYHSVSSPFTATLTKPKQLKTAGNVDKATGLILPNGYNTYQFLLRKGVVTALGVAPQVMRVRVIIDVPVGAETYDAPNVNAAISVINGLTFTLSPQTADTVKTGSL